MSDVLLGLIPIWILLLTLAIPGIWGKAKADGAGVMPGVGNVVGKSSMSWLCRFHLNGNLWFSVVRIEAREGGRVAEDKGLQNMVEVL